jgi:hypothetical protein
MKLAPMLDTLLIASHNRRIDVPILYPMKLNRKQISEAMQSVPLESVLLGATAKGEKQLTARQAAFAEAIALGETKAGAYRKAYNSKGKPHTASRRGQEVAKIGAVQAQIDALKLANEARKYATPAALRSLVIERLTAHAIDDTVKPAQRLRALELLGKVTEIAAFTERREIVKLTSSIDAKAQLLSVLRAAINSQAIDVMPKLGAPMPDEVIEDGGMGLKNASDALAAAPHPRDCAAPTPAPLLSIPHPQSAEISAATQITNSDATE